MPTIYHLTTAAWEAGKAAGVYTVSTRGKTLKGVGFLHGSQSHQVAPVANWLYEGTGAPLVDLVIDGTDSSYNDCWGWLVNLKLLAGEVIG